MQGPGEGREGGGGVVRDPAKDSTRNRTEAGGDPSQSCERTSFSCHPAGQG